MDIKMLKNSRPLTVQRIAHPLSTEQADSPRCGVVEREVVLSTSGEIARIRNTLDSISTLGVFPVTVEPCPLISFEIKLPKVVQVRS